MKKTIVRLLVGVMCVALLQGCYGKFPLVRTVYRVNGEVGNKFLRSGLTWVLLILPVYGLAGLADFVILNTIEFWSGRNPLAEGEKTFQFVDGADRYEVLAKKQGDDVTYFITRYNFDRYVDSLQVEWNQTRDVATSRYRSGVTVVENYAVRNGSEVTAYLRSMGNVPLTAALTEKRQNY
jgi:hypothetical protein